MKLSLPMSCLAALALCVGCDEKKAADASIAAQEQGVVAEEISTVAVDGKQIAQETITATNIPAAGVAAPSIRDPKLWSFLPEVIAKVDGKDVTRQQYIDFVAAQVSEGKMPPIMNNPALLKEVAPIMIKNYIDKPLLNAAAVKAGFVASPELVAKIFKEQLSKATPLEAEAFKEQLRKQGMTLDQFIEKISADKATQERTAIEAFIDATVASKVVVTAEEAQKFYNEHKDYFMTGDPDGTIRASHILIMARKGKATPEEMVAARKKADEILAQLKKDQTKFEELAEKESACPSGKKEKGSLGAFGKDDMVTEFSEAAFKLKEGEISGIVQTDFGFHIIRRDKSQAPVVPPFKDVEQEIMGMMKNQKIQLGFTELIAKLEKENKVEFFVTKESLAKSAAPAGQGAAPAPAAK